MSTGVSGGTVNYPRATCWLLQFLGAEEVGTGAVTSPTAGPMLISNERGTVTITRVVTVGAGGATIGLDCATMNPIATVTGSDAQILAIPVAP